MQIYVHRNNQQIGPFTEQEVRAQLASGAISLQDHAWWQGQANWVPLAQTPFAGTPAPGLPSATSASVFPPGTFPAHEKTSNLALWSLICGIGSLLCGILFIPAIVLGHMGLAETAKNPAIKGRGMALSGMIIGYVLLALYLVSIIAISILIALGHQVKTNFSTLEEQLQNVQTHTSQDDPDSNQSTNSADQATNDSSATNSDSSTNSPPAVTP